MDNATFETQDLRIRIEDNVARIDQRSLSGEPWREIDHSELPVTPQWRDSNIRTSPLRVALVAFERENPGNTTLRTALGAETPNKKAPRQLAVRRLSLWTKFLPAIVATLAATAAASRAIRFRTGFVHIQRPAVEVPAIEFVDGAIRFGVIAHLHESKPSRLARIPVRNDAHAIHGSICLKQGSNRTFGCTETQVSYKNILHLGPLIVGW
jgi:hypothetical protein